MEYLALPLEVRRDGSLATTRLEDAIACLIQASARTPSGTCAWCPPFGILDLLEKQTQAPPGMARPQLMRDATNRLNQTIEMLAGKACKVLSIVPRPQGELGACTFELNILWNNGITGSISVGEVA